MQNTKSDCSSRFCFTCERKICAENSVLIIELKSSPNLKHYPIAQKIGLPENEKVAALIVYGYEAGEHHEAPVRKDINEILRFVE